MRTDITQLKQREAELEEAREQAEAANLAKSTFLAAASHDLRQPLHAIGLFVDSLSRRAWDAEALEIIDNVNRSLVAMNRMFGQLLDISRLDAGVLSPSISDFPVERLFHVLEAEFGQMAASQDLTLRIVPTRAFVTSDQALLERIVRNLMANAIHHTPKGRVLLGCRRRGENVRIEVRDTGEGIPPDQLSKIFEEFHQLGRPQRGSERGLGLGLAIVDRLARLLGHTIDVVSTPGRGSVFSVEIPAATQTENIVERRTSQLATGDVSGSFIALVEDEPDVLESTRALLEDWGCRVAAASTAEGLLQALTEGDGEPDLIIADYRLGGGRTGIQAIDSIRRQLPHEVPAVIISGDTAPERLREVRASGHKLLHKPLRPAKLRSTIVVMLNEWMLRAD